MTTWLRHICFIVAALLILAAPLTAQPAFTEVSPLTDPLWVTDQTADFWINTVASADVDGDGDLDLAVLGFYVVYFESATDRLVLFLNDGPGTDGRWTFTQRELPLAPGGGPGAADLIFGDFDSDGDPDLAVGSSGNTFIYRNDAAVLTPLPNALPPYFEDSSYTAAYDFRSLSWADTDNDGDLDLLVPSVFDRDTFQYRTRLVRNDGPDGSGGWVFTDTSPGLDPTHHAQTAWADDDKDGDLDLLMVNVDDFQGEHFIRRYQNQGGIFGGQDVLDIVVTRGIADWGDFDADGDMDILVAGLVRSGEFDFETVLRVYRNDGAGVYVAETLAVPEQGWLDFHAASWADYNSDGVMDLLVTGSFIGEAEIEGRSEIYINNGGTFTPIGADLSAPVDSIGRGGTFSWLDIDGDGDLDYLVAGAYFVPGGNGLVEAQIHLYRNDAAETNGAPSLPSSLSATDMGNGTVLLSWGAAADDSTTSDALTYELEITPSTESIRTAAAAGQQRRLPQPGNVSAVTNWKLRNLPAGTYDWSVRAVDSAFNGGPRASGTFTVTRPPEPIAAIGWPKHGATVSRRVPIHIGAIDDHDSPAELRVFLLFAGRYFLPMTFNSGLQLFSGVWNTVGIPDGSYQLRALVLDSEGHWGASAPVWVNVNNVP